jgi:hypothetical protein
VLRLDGHTGSSICGGVGKAAAANVGRNVPRDKDVLGVTVAPVPVEATVEIDARRKARIVDVDPFFHRGLDIDRHTAIDHRTLHGGAIDDHIRSDHRGGDRHGASEEKGCRSNGNRNENE